MEKGQLWGILSQLTKDIISHNNTDKHNVWQFNFEIRNNIYIKVNCLPFPGTHNFKLHYLEKIYFSIALY